MKREVIIQFVSYLFIFLFLYTGIMKIVDHAVFEVTIDKSPLLRGNAVLISILVPAIEFLIVATLLHPKTRKMGLTASFILMSIFTLYVGFMLYMKHDELPCSCGGIINLLNWHQHLYLNTIFTLLALTAIWQSKLSEQVKQAKQ